MIWLRTGEEANKRYIKSAGPINLYAWNEIEIKGTLTSKGYSSGGKGVYVVKTDTTVLENGYSWERRYYIRLYDVSELMEHVETRSRVSLIVRLYEFPELRNPHDFNYGGWLHNRQIVAHGEIKYVTGIEKSNGFGWADIRERVRQNIDSIFSQRSAPLAKALFLGYKEEITDVTRQNFSRSGLSHVMAVSGLHVGFIVAPIWLIIPFLWRRRWGKWLGLILLTVLLTGYAGLTGFSASVCRASIMAWLLTCGRLFHKVRNSINLTACAAIILLMIDPGQLFNLGFQLSFSAVFIILLILPAVQNLIPNKKRFKISGALLTIILVSVVVQAGLYPLLTYYFGEFSIVGPVANAVVIPLLTVTVPAGLLISVAPGANTTLLYYAAIPVEWTLQWVEFVADNLGGRDFSYVAINNESLFLFLFWGVLILYISSIRIPELRWKILILLLVTFNILMGELICQKNRINRIQITFLDVGQGDAIHIKTPSGKHILVDTGRWSPGFNSGEKTILPYLNNFQIDELEALVLSHPHADHIGGVKSMLEKISIHMIYQSDYNYDSQLFTRYMDAAKRQGIPISDLYAGDTVYIEDNVRFYVLGPKKSVTKPSNPNNHSVVLKLVYGETSFLLSGDAEKEQESEITNIYGDFLKADLYKMGHHGSSTSSTNRFLSHISPDLTVVSLSFRNRFGHPNQEAVTRISNYSKEVYFTSLQGALVFESDGKKIELVDWK